ncbi:MAG: PAS domain-containing sensor histidine kinase [Pseudohongiellaceae bacterium]
MMSIVTSTVKNCTDAKIPNLYCTELELLNAGSSEVNLRTGFDNASAEHFPNSSADSNLNLVLPGLENLRESESPVIGIDKGRENISVESLMNAMPSGVVVLDNQGRIQRSNPVANELLGSLRVGQPWRDIISAKFEPRRDDGHEVSLKNGKRVSLNTRSLGGGGGQLILITDLTETRKLQTQLSRHQRLSAMGKMMSSLAHQIRTPLAAALLHADNLVSRSEPDSATTKTGLTIISRLRNIERQIRDMLVFAKGGVAQTTQIAPAILIEHMRDSARDLAEHYGAEITWSDEGTTAELHCNLDAIMGAFLNLLENAIQASDQHPKVSVNVSFDQPKRGESILQIEVIDEGIGINESTTQLISEPFNTTKTNGNGLGLSIVRLVCQAHGGEFQLMDNGNGATARMIIPANLPGVSL